MEVANGCVCDRCCQRTVFTYEYYGKKICKRCFESDQQFVKEVLKQMEESEPR